MSKRVTLTLTFPHTLGAVEVRRRLDRYTAWAFEQFAKDKITIEADDWFDDRRGFSASGHGMRAGAAIQVEDDALYVEALVPVAVGVFAPVIEIVGRHYAWRLLSNECASV